MTKQVKITKTENGISVASPYNSEFIAKAKQNGGRWNPAKKTWDFASDREARLNELLFKIYDFDMTGDIARYDVLININEYMTVHDFDLEINGKVVAHRNGRDGDVLFNGVYEACLEAGEFESRGGSVKYPKVTGTKDCVVRVEGVAVCDLEMIKDRAGVTVISK